MYNKPNQTKVSTPTISYFNIDKSNLSKFHDSIDERLSILGGVVRFERLTKNLEAYSYDFKNVGTCEPQTGTATVFIHNNIISYNKKFAASVQLTGFFDNSFYKKLYDSLFELREHL